ncbi:hypothetical protein L9F63_006721 [Diploptera punctata]|uniref:Protein shisa-5-like n=1 Tax=Diploptera punctata TaxID=6984 RepID=A0AAD7Z984_DIPPU|nr:hypothetical protein L9F63_006721 [Diploptera punctata]
MGSDRIAGAVLLVLGFLQSSSCMECQLGHESTFFEKLDFINPKQCPTPLDNRDDEFCCVDDNRVFCCDAAQFFGNGFGVLLPVLIVIIVGFLIVCCLCCLCCPCCLLYKRRHRGTVYGNVLEPGVQTGVVTVHQQPQSLAYPPQPVPGYTQPAPYPPQPGMQTGVVNMPQPQPQPLVHAPPPMPGYTQPAPYPSYPPQPEQQPPPYSDATAHEVYSKQAPFNPNFK